ncbi:MAG: hypothetical protein Q9226_004011 [Calogaya cf. arnoldii]
MTKQFVRKYSWVLKLMKYAAAVKITILYGVRARKPLNGTLPSEPQPKKSDDFSALKGTEEAGHSTQKKIPETKDKKYQNRTPTAKPHSVLENIFLNLA